MKIQYCSDLHLEFKENKRFLEQNPIEPVGEILLLAGDILPFSLHQKETSFIDRIADQFEMVYWIPGNHEYYNYDLTKVANPLFEKLRSNVFIINNKTINYQHINIICTTLWSKIGPVNALDIQRSISDFFSIRYNGAKFTTPQFNELHNTCFAYLRSELKGGKNENTIVVTHHVPTFQNYPAKYRHSLLNEAFAVELYNFIHDCGASHWIYGHNHDNTDIFNIGKTQMRTNQLGYVARNEHLKYRKNTFIEI